MAIISVVFPARALTLVGFVDSKLQLITRGRFGPLRRESGVHLPLLLRLRERLQVRRRYVLDFHTHRLGASGQSSRVARSSLKRNIGKAATINVRG